MQRKRDGSLPIGEVFGGLDGPVKALIPSPQALHHFTHAESGESTWSRPAKRTPISASWRGCWCCAPFAPQ